MAPAPTACERAGVPPTEPESRRVGDSSASAPAVTAGLDLSTLAPSATTEAPTLQPAEIDPPPQPEPAPASSVEELLAELGRVSTTAADRIERGRGRRLDAPGDRDGSGRTVTALDIVRSMVDAGVGHLRAAREVLEAVRGWCRDRHQSWLRRSRWR